MVCCAAHDALQARFDGAILIGRLHYVGPCSLYLSELTIVNFLFSLLLHGVVNIEMTLNPRSALETGVLLLMCCVWTPYAMLIRGYRAESFALSITGFALATIHYIINKGKLPLRWKDVIRPTSIDSGLLYGTSLVSMSFAAHLLHQPSATHHDMELNFWASIANSINFGLGLQQQQQQGSFLLRVFNACISVCCVVFGLAPPGIKSYWLYLLTMIMFCELCLELVVRGMKHSFTLGEALLVVQYVGMATCDAVRYLFTQDQQTKRRGVDLAVQFGVLGCLWLACALIPFFKQSKVNALNFYSVCVVFLGGVVAPAAYVVIGENPIWFVRDFTFSTFDHVYLLAYWCVVLALALPLIHSQVNKLPLVIIRKLYHVLALAMFAPAIHFTRDFLALGFGVAAGLALLIEYIRACRVYPLGKWLDHYLRAYTDDRDDGIFILTHLYLLLGCAVSVWAAQYYEGMAAYAGVLVLGAGDAAAAIVGSQYGKIRWLSTTRKTVEGTVAGFIAMLLVSELMFEQDFNRKSMVIACIATLALEAFTTQIDNLVLPIVFLSCLRI